MGKLPKGTPAIILGLLLALGLAGWWGHRASHRLALKQSQSSAQRQATMAALALADLVAAELGTEREDGQSSLDDTLLRWQSLQQNLNDLRVLRLSGARLLASTEAADQQLELPARLPRDQKAFFDLGQELRAGHDTNLAEQVFRKEELALEVLDDGRLRLTAPWPAEGKIEGVVRLSFSPRQEQVPLTTGALWLLVLLPPLVLLALALVLPKQHARLLTLAAAALIFMLAIILFNRHQVAAFQGSRLHFEQQLAADYLKLRTTIGTVAAEQGIQLALTENTWDTDLFRRPLALIDAEGKPKQQAIGQAQAENVRILKAQLRAGGLIAALLFLFFALGMAETVRHNLVTYRESYAYIAPAMIGMLILVFFPFIYGLVLGFTDQTLYNTDKPLNEIWVGLDNFVEIMGNFDLIRQNEEGWIFNYENFYWTLFITIAWTVCNVSIGVSVGLGLALALNNPTLRFKVIYRAILILPWAIPNYVTALIWKGLFHQQFGPINQVVQMFGMEPIAWYDGVFSSFVTGVTVNGWLSFPFMMVICLGALQSISQDMYEAARLDGASRFQQFRYITLPSLKPTLIPAIIISIVWTFNMFNIIYLVSGGEPGGSNEILITKAYKIAFEKYQYGYAAAYSTVIFLILLAYGIFQSKMSNATEDQNK